jgi:hypothetical protein
MFVSPAYHNTMSVFSAEICVPMAEHDRDGNLRLSHENFVHLTRIESVSHGVIYLCDCGSTVAKRKRELQKDRMLESSSPSQLWAHICNGGQYERDCLHAR